MLLSTLITSVTWRPRCLGAARNSSVLARLHGADGDASEHARMEEGVAGPACELDESVLFALCRDCNAPMGQ